jgi:hypothetical protein
LQLEITVSPAQLAQALHEVAPLSPEFRLKTKLPNTIILIIISSTILMLAVINSTVTVPDKYGILG